MPTLTSGGVAFGRLMDGSFHFIPPEGSAGDALVFSFGLTSLTGGIAGLATPAYYPLAAVSDLLAEPIPVLIPLVDTFLLGTDFRFYVPAAGPSLTSRGVTPPRGDPRSSTVPGRGVRRRRPSWPGSRTR